MSSSSTPKVKRPARSPKKHFVIHPLSREGYHQIWVTETGVDYGPGYEGFDSSEGTYGYLYPMKDGHIVFCNEFNRPKAVFNEKADVVAWLQSRAENVEWI